MSFNSYVPDLYGHAKITFIHLVINAQWHAKVGLPFFETPCTVLHTQGCSGVGAQGG